MPRILIAECKQEVASFNPVLSHYEDFTVSFGDDVVARHRGVRSEVAGALSVFESRPGVRVVPAYSARAITSGGTLAAPDFDRIAREFLSGVRGADHVDAVYFALHGAMASENEEDPEGHRGEPGRPGRRHVHRQSVHRPAGALLAKRRRDG